MARIVKVDGSATDVDLNIEAFQTAVGGYIEPICLPGGGLMFVNEEGRRLNLPYNSAASQLAGIPLVGDVVVLSREEAGKELL